MRTDKGSGIAIDQSRYDAKYKFVWVFMSVHSAEGSRGAPSGIFSCIEDAEKWIRKSKVAGNLYRFPLDIALTEYSELLNGERPFIKKHYEKDTEEYKAGAPYLGFIPHSHY